MNSRNLLNKGHLYKASAVALSLIVLFLFPSFVRTADASMESAYSLVRGQLQPDTNIVIIDISKSDVDNLGSWPIKRSYYALLIRSLNSYSVKSVGLEIFLSAKFVTQALYDNLLTDEIENSGHVVLSSISGDVYLKDGKFLTDSLSFPSPKLLDDKLITGHLNYFSDDEIRVPLIIHDGNISEKSFALELAMSSRKLSNTGNEIKDGKLLNVNFISSWNKFKRIGLLKYFEMLNQNDPSLLELKDKIIIIGTSDPQIGPSLSTAFDDDLPGMALHAFALDNILKDRSLNSSFNFSSKLLFILLIAALILIRYKYSIRLYAALLIVIILSFFILTFILYASFNLQVAYAFFLIPFVVISAADLVFYIIERNILLEGIIDESNILKTLFTVKEQELVKLQKEFDLGSGASNSLLEKIKLLKSDIEKLKENEEDKRELELHYDGEVQSFYGIVYRSKTMKSVVDLISKAAPGDANILILGESGTGKELAAHAIHSLSSRCKNNFVAVNCGALSDTLLESELFGHVKGAFTGAVMDKMGRFEAANNGTIFLDEIAETTENFQVKLLRIIQSGDFEKVGSSKTQHTDVRIVAATNKRLENEIKSKNFREDLYYRLNVIKIELPPLRERKEDIEILARHFLAKENGEMKLSAAAAEALTRYEWKGNVRELEAIIKRAVIFAKSAERKLIQLADLPEELVKDSKFGFDDMVIESLRSKKFSRSSIIETAKELGNVSRTIISENFRGYSLKTYVENNFDFEAAVRVIAGSEEEEIISKTKNKLSLFLKNIETDINGLSTKDFERIKLSLVSKYKNLPHKFHYYLDEIIKRYLSN